LSNKKTANKVTRGNKELMISLRLKKVASYCVSG